MPKKSMHVLMVIMLLAASALACTTLMGGNPTDLSIEDLEATADALAEDSPAQATIEAAEATAEALIGDDGNDNGDDGNDNGDDGNENGDDNGNESVDSPFADGPADIPVLDENAELLFADDASLTYYTDASFDDTVEFYRAEMPNAGWEATANGDVVFGGIASLQFDMDGKLALIAVSTDPTSDRTLVAITVTE